MKVQRILVFAGWLVYAPSTLASRDQVVLEDPAATRATKNVAIIGKTLEWCFMSLHLTL